ncbi:hypothetical protein D9758_005841 [Tetrapyrgos nigripes]|uniref:Mitochondrial ATPase n=1 Tax=Tetrapyrgos nigripes TaxID=182062 RepID=A0A8H5LHJ6_9AGAR|nr:hypothetical protein D9758_005841 [Tetrapyrgos nigripes]
MRSYAKCLFPRLGAHSRFLSTLPQQVDLLDRYRGLVALGKIQYDEPQVRVIMQLRRLQRELRDYTPVGSSTYAYWDRNEDDGTTHSYPNWWSTPSKEESEPSAVVRFKGHAEELASLQSPKGLLLTGPPGSGKTFIVDLWYSALPTRYKARKHYNELVLEIYRAVWEITQQRMAELSSGNSKSRPVSSLWNASASSEWKKIWQKIASRGRYPYQDLSMAYAVAQRLIRHHWLLVFDEIQMLDVSSASLLADVLSWFWRMGGVVVGTSNKIPEDLYQNGVQRDRLEPFVEALKARCPVLPIDVEEGKDWRMVKAELRLPDSRSTWFIGEEMEDFKSVLKGVLSGKISFPPQHVRIITRNIDPHPSQVSVFGRNLPVPWTSNGACKYAFHELCDEELGPADYITLASTFHTMILDQVPVLKLSDKDKARRFISLIDALYEARCKIIILAESMPEGIFFPDAAVTTTNMSRSTKLEEMDIMMAESVGETRDTYRPNVSAYDAPSKDEQFAFKRALSRLVEMTSPTYNRDEVWTPLPSSSRKWELASDQWAVHRAGRGPGTAKRPSRADSNDDFAVEAAYERSADTPREFRPAPRLREHHVWGVRDDWGEGAGKWGKGAKAHEDSSSTSSESAKKQT